MLCFYHAQAPGVVRGVFHPVVVTLEVLPLSAEQNTGAEAGAGGTEESGR